MASITFQNWAKPDSIASSLNMKYDEFQSYRTLNKAKWTEIESYLYATDTTTLEGGNAHDHTTHIPIVASIKEELEAIMYAAVLPHEDFLGWKPYESSAATKKVRRAVVEYIQNRHALNDFDRVFRKLIQDLVIYGNCFAKVCYVDERKNGIGYVGPKCIRISPYDIVFDPTRSSFEDSPKFVREVLSLSEFMRLYQNNPMVDPAVLREVMERRNTYGRLSRSEQNKAKQFIPDGFTSLEAYMTSGYIEVLWFYGDVYDQELGDFRLNRCVAVVDRVHVLFDFEETDPMIFKGSWATKPDSLWSQGPLDKIVGLNYQINHRENSKSDALDRFIHPDREFRGDVEEVYNDETGQTTYLAPEGGGVRNIVPDTTVLTADMHQERLLQTARAAVGLPPQLLGFRTPGEKTLGEVQTLDDAALRKFLHKAEQFEMDLLERVISSEIAVGAANFQSVIDIMTKDSDGLPEMLQVTKADLEANGKLVPMGARRFKRRNQQMTMIQTLANSSIAQLISKHINTYALAQVVEEVGGFGQFEFIKKFGALEEASEEQITLAALEQYTVDVLSQPSPAEAEDDVLI